MNYVCCTRLRPEGFATLNIFIRTLLLFLFFFQTQNIGAQCSISCRDTTVVCAAGTHPSDLGMPATTGCVGTVNLIRVDVVNNLPCSDPGGNIGHIERTWYAVDSMGNRDTCIQNVFIEKGTLPEVTLVPAVNLFCENSSRTAPNTFFPEIGGHPLSGGGFCNLEAFIVNETVFDSCDINVFKLTRTWLIRDSCANNSIQLTQSVNFVDTLAPTVTCLDTLRFDTETATCVGEVIIPDPTISNNCSTTEDLFIDIPGVGSGSGPHQNVAAGQYDAIYKVVDCSQDTGYCTTILLVEDSETPTAVCREFTVISLTSTPFVDVPASSFDEGSYDNCDDVRFLVSRDGIDFSDRARFDCSDIGTDSIMVILRVYERHDPSMFDQCMVFARVDDKLAPSISCPGDRTIDCQDDYSDLSVFGAATANDACGFLITETSLQNISGCGTGTIERRFVARDSSGNENSCSQTIFIENLSPVSVSAITWPADSIFNICDPNLHPDSLPPAYSRPVFGNDPCSMFFVNYTDERFDVSFPACFKLFRTWKVIEMCSGQEFTHVQKLIVMDRTKPQLNCSPDIVQPADSDCKNTSVIIPPATVTDCDPKITLSWSTPLNSGTGGDASGDFPTGTTIITYEAIDGCGNGAVCRTSVTVTDLTPPIVKAHSLVSIELGIFNSVVEAVLDASTLNAGSKDNCSPKANLQYFIREHSTPVGGIPSTDFMKYDCDDIGFDTVELWGIDEAGNSDYVIVEVEVQDNFNRCSGNRPAAISGFVKTEDDMPLSGFPVYLNGTNGILTYTDSLGFYQFENLKKGDNYTITPFNNTNASEGVSTFDLVEMSKYILNVSPLGSPFRIIAADVNNTGNVSTTDIIALRKVILRATNEFPTNTSWRFIDESYQFQKPQKPLSENLPAERIVSDLQGEISEVNFVGIKVGDVNGSISDDIKNRTMGEPFQVEAVKDSEGVYWLKNLKAESLEGLQLALNFGGEQIEISEVLAGVLPGFTQSNISIFEGRNLLVSWSGGEELAVGQGSRLFGVKFKKAALEMPEIMPEVMRPEVYTNGLIRSFEIGDKPAPEEQYELFQNKPNPFKETTQISFKLPEETTARLTVFDLSGKVVKVINGEFPAGEHQIRLNKNELKDSGVYFYQLETPRFTATKKMILL